MNNRVAQVVEASARRLFSTLSLEQVLAKLLLEEAQRNLIIYRSHNLHFENKYG